MSQSEQLNTMDLRLRLMATMDPDDQPNPKILPAIFSQVELFAMLDRIDFLESLIQGIHDRCFSATRG